MSPESLRAALVIAIIVGISATGFATILRGLRIFGRRSRAECLQCGYPKRPPTLATTEGAAVAQNVVCTECGRDSALDPETQRNATLLIATGIAMQAAWLLLGAARWTAAAILLVETTVALLVFTVEPLLLRLIRKKRSPVSTLPAVRRPWFLRVAAALIVLLGWGWIFARYEHGKYLRSIMNKRPDLSPVCRTLVSNGTEWMESVLPPDLIFHSRIDGFIAEIGSNTRERLPPTLEQYVLHAWVNAPLDTATTLLDLTRVRELRIFGLDEAAFAALDLDRLPDFSMVRTLDLDGSSIDPDSIELLVQKAPRVETVRVNYLAAEQAADIRERLAHLNVDTAEVFRPMRGGPRTR